MSSITIRNLPNATKESLRVKAAKQGISLEAYTRGILQKVSQEETEPAHNLAELARQCFGPTLGTDLDLPPRGSNRPPLSFD
jgi:plasmid stability protein